VADTPRPSTLLLGGAAMWSLCLLVLALGGLGTRFAAPEHVAAPPPLPEITLTATKSRLQPWEAYADLGTRPLLNERRQPVAVAIQDSGANSDDLDVTLSSVLITSRLKLAIFTDNKDGSSKRVVVGNAVEGTNWRLVSLAPRQAVMEGPGGQRKLDLRVYDGRSGEAPTAVNGNSEAQDASATAPPGPRVVPSPAPPPVPQANPPTANVDKPDPNQMSQEEQVEAIRRRIEARRAQMRAEAESAAAQNR
jgi:general secretion pathway protein N